MGFQQLPNLPDYSKLTFYLNNSGVQAWNPAVYDILKQLIGAVGQSQDVITQSIIPDSSIVNVSPTGALNGDGSLVNPLAVKVDGVTVTIVGDQLVAAVPVIAYFNTSFTISGAQMMALNSVPIILVAGVASHRIIPIYLSSHTLQDVQYSGNVICTLRYAGVAVDVSNGATLVIGTTPGTHVWNRGLSVGSSFSPAGDITVAGLNLVLRGDTDVTVGGGINGSSITGNLLYAIVTDS